ncbi:hypothetical protein [Devosia salina]|uniref:Uncharacterized protein n=1 Tax=Devosia salina TaxID=2860336 RepID=A0ABX8WA92_9HYPH|nr:hypothetical protein [Devosia salina]QYO75611.1 hypothetical protein K1X15_13325 [Devosia salina]
MKLAESLIAWNANSNEIAVGGFVKEGDIDWTRPYRKTGGAAYTEVRKPAGIEARHYIMSEFLGIVIRDRVDLDAAHKAFLVIDEYRQAIPHDVDGADQFVEE